MMKISRFASLVRKFHNMKILIISVDVTDLSVQEVDDLRENMESHIEEYGASLLNSDIKNIKEDEEDTVH